MYIKRNSIFLIDREPDKPDGKLRYRIKWDSHTVAFNVGFRVEFDKWSRETQRCNNNTTHGKKKISAAVINREINRFEQLADEVFRSYESAGSVPTADEFRAAFNSLNGKAPVREKTLFTLYDEFTAEMGSANQWTRATYQKFATLKNHLAAFAPQLTFEQLDEAGLHDFVGYLRDTLNMRNSTIGKQLGFLKWFLRWADNKGYNSERAFLTYSPKLKCAERKVVFLDWEELMTVNNYVIPSNGTVVTLTDPSGKEYEKIVSNAGTLAKVRDVFCFCCFTSLRYSDVANLRRSDVFDDHISITTVKTADSIRIELNDYSRELLARYADQTFPRNLALPVISNQKMNDYLKELTELCGINKPMTVTYYKGNRRIDEVYPKYALIGTHCGRRTFICNALMLGIPPQIVMKWTGHSDYKSMKPYIDIADKAKKDAMQAFNKKSPNHKIGD